MNRVEAGSFHAARSLLFLGSCGGGDGSTVCTTEVRTSIGLTIVDSLDRQLTGVSVSWQVGAGALQTLTCDSQCSFGFDQPGTFRITASKTGFVPVTLDVTVAKEDCHVKGESRTLKLLPAG